MIQRIVRILPDGAVPIASAGALLAGVVLVAELGLQVGAFVAFLAAFVLLVKPNITLMREWSGKEPQP